MPFASVTSAPCDRAYASSRDRSPTPLEPASGAIASVESVPNARPCLSMNALPESPGMPGVTVNTEWFQPPADWPSDTPSFGESCVMPARSDELPYDSTFAPLATVLVIPVGPPQNGIDGIEPEQLKIGELYARVERADPPVGEVVLATNTTTTGEATALYIADGLRQRAPGVAVTRLASGLPVGGDLEYADEVTLGRAFAGRRAL